MTLNGVCLFAWLSLVLLYWVYPAGSTWGKHSLTRRSTTKPIPGPRSLPPFGSMSIMSKLAHHKLAAVAERCKAKRLMVFSFGETRVIITSNPDVAKEILNNSVFADHPVKESAYGLRFHRAIGFAPYGVYWSTLRRIAATHLFSPKQSTSYGPQRLRISTQMVSMLSTSSSGKVRVRDVLKKASLNNMMCSIFGCEYELGVWNEEMEELSQLVEEGYDLLGKFNWSETQDFVDVLLSLHGAD